MLFDAVFAADAPDLVLAMAMAMAMAMAPIIAGAPTIFWSVVLFRVVISTDAFQTMNDTVLTTLVAQGCPITQSINAAAHSRTGSM
ncbi:MAG: hypothetical protein AB8B64_01135 [Granulosicoccus sp.]